MLSILLLDRAVLQSWFYQERDGVWGTLGAATELGARVLARGQADLVLGAVAAGRNNNGGAQGRKASPEWSSTDCQPCVNL